MGRRRARPSISRISTSISGAGRHGRSLARADTRRRASPTKMRRASSVSSPWPASLNGPGFQKMRDDLRRNCTEIWVIDCSPEGHQPEVADTHFSECAAAGLHRARGPKARQECRRAGASAIHAAPEGHARGKVCELCKALARRLALARWSERLARSVPAGREPARGRFFRRSEVFSSTTAQG